MSYSVLINRNPVDCINTIISAAGLVSGITSLSCLLAPSALAQPFAKEALDKSPRHLEWVDVKSKTHKVKCFVAYPEVKTKASAVIVIHEIFGLTDWVRSVADQLAQRGYIAICPDLLSGSGPGGGGTAEIGGEDKVRRVIQGLDPEIIKADLDATAAYVTALPACNKKLTVGGFCWGGTQTFKYATNNKNLKASFVFYGSGPESKADITRIAAPVYGFYAENDSRIGATLPATEKLMKEAKKVFQPVTYAGAGHGFMRSGQAPTSDESNKKAREQAWDRWGKLLKAI